MVRVWFVSTVVVTLLTSPVYAQDADALAKKLSNPIASLISVPFKFDADFGFGAGGDGEGYGLTIQPVVPFSLNQDWNVISRKAHPDSN